MTRVTFYGVRGSCPCSDAGVTRYGGSTSCVAVESDGSAVPLILDLGTGARRLGIDLLERFAPNEGVPAGAPGDGRGERGGPASDPQASVPDGAVSHYARPPLELHAFVTHLHFDHVQGLPFFGPALRPGTQMSIYGPRQAAGSLRGALEAFVRPPYFPVTLGELPAKLEMVELSDGAVELGWATVRAREVPHIGSTLGYRVETGGVSVAYVSDHQGPQTPGGEQRPVPVAVLELCADADLVIHDAQYTYEEFAVKGHWGHSTPAYALQVALEAGARSLALFHHDPTHDDEQLDRLARSVSMLPGADELESVFVAAEATSIELVPSGRPAVRSSASGQLAGPESQAGRQSQAGRGGQRS